MLDPTTQGSATKASPPCTPRDVVAALGVTGVFSFFLVAARSDVQTVPGADASVTARTRRSHAKRLLRFRSLRYSWPAPLIRDCLS
jgi:hypothetical protein